MIRNMGTTTIEVSNETWRQLNRRKDPGESFDDVLQDMMTATIRELEPGNEPEYVDHREIDGSEECAHMIPDRGECHESADYMLVFEYEGGKQEVPYCEKHANLPEKA